jgi:hypothetical protein
MAEHTAERSAHGTLVAATVDTVTLGADWAHVEVTNLDTTSPIYVRVDGTAPTVAGEETFVVPAGGYRILEVPTATDTVVELISAGTPDYAVTGL